jgi:hypothetical protein
MATKKIKCRTHGGFFTVEARRGRPPVKCTEDNQCDAQRVPTSASSGRVRIESNQPVATLNVGRSANMASSKTRTSAATAASESVSDSAGNASWQAGRQATVKEVNRVFTELSKLGWNAKRSWEDKTTAEITATRGDEMIYVTVTNGQSSMQYSLWSFDKPQENGKPTSKLPFDPDEIGDRELVRLLAGVKVTWYNRLSGKEEHAYCGAVAIRVEHGYNARGDEMPGERIIKFTDPDDKHFKAFRLDQLLKVGR